MIKIFFTKKDENECVRCQSMSKYTDLKRNYMQVCIEVRFLGKELHATKRHDAICDFIPKTKKDIYVFCTFCIFFSWLSSRFLFVFFFTGTSTEKESTLREVLTCVLVLLHGMFLLKW